MNPHFNIAVWDSSACSKYVRSTYMVYDVSAYRNAHDHVHVMNCQRYEMYVVDYMVYGVSAYRNAHDHVMNCPRYEMHVVYYMV